MSMILRKISEVTYQAEPQQLASRVPASVLEIFNIFQNNGFEIRIVGGAVRDLLMGKQPKDFDFSTNAKPNQIAVVCRSSNLKCVETGLKHGTLTAILDRHQFEITTLRQDVATDGRHAEVKFINDWRLDAERRDLTVNAMSMNKDWVLFDYFGGVGDLQVHRIRFVLDPRTRIREDYLRILRYFRFYGRIGVAPPTRDSFEAATLEIIREEAQNLRKISAERIWSELARILTGNFAPQLIQLMHELTVLQHCGLAAVAKSDLDRFTQYHANVFTREPVPVTVRDAAMLSAFFTEPSAAEWACRNLKLSNEARDLCSYIVYHRHKDYRMIDTFDVSLVRYQRIMVFNEEKMEKTPLVNRLVQLMLCEGAASSDIKTLQIWPSPSCPVNGDDLNCYVQGPLLAKVLASLRIHWIESNFVLTKDQLVRTYLLNRGSGANRKPPS